MPRARVIKDMWTTSFPPKPTFDVDRDIPDLTGKVMIVTGGNTGIGKETVKVLLRHNAKVYMASRSADRAMAAINELKEETGKEALFLHLDLGNMAAVTRAAQEFKSKESKLDVLFNSAGVMVPPIDQFTSDGYDLQFGTNLLGPAHFTLLLIPELRAGAYSSPDGKSRIVNTASSAAHMADHIDYGVVKGDSRERTKLGKQGLYNQSKLGNIMFSFELAKRYGSEGIVSTAIIPGFIRTELQKHLFGPAQPILRVLFHPAPMGALTQLYAGTVAAGADMNGGYLIPWARVGDINAVSDAGKKPEQWAELWNWIEVQRKNYL